VAPCHAFVASAAGGAGLDRHPVADAHSGHVLPDGEDGAGGLVAEDDRSLDLPVADVAHAVVGGIGSADADGLDLDERLLGREGRGGYVLHLDGSEGRHHGCADGHIRPFAGAPSLAATARHRWASPWRTGNATPPSRVVHPSSGAPLWRMGALMSAE